MGPSKLGFVFEASQQSGSDWVLRNATGCASCVQPTSVSSLRVTWQLLDEGFGYFSSQIHSVASAELLSNHLSRSKTPLSLLYRRWVQLHLG